MRAISHPENRQRERRHDRAARGPSRREHDRGATGDDRDRRDLDPLVRNAVSSFVQRDQQGDAQ